VCPLIQSGKTVMCFIVDKSTIVALMASVSGLDWSNTPSFSLFQMRPSAYSLSHTCAIIAVFYLYTNCIIPYTASTVLVPQTFVRYEVVSSILPSVGPYPSMVVVLSMCAMIHPWYPFAFSTDPSLAVPRLMSDGMVLNMFGGGGAWAYDMM
jgi:hypothetical protein